MKWAFELEEFELVYRPRTAIKYQALVDFLAEFTYLENPIEEPTQPNLPLELQASILTWVLYVDRFSNNQGSGTGMILTIPNDFQIKCTLRFRFEASNTKV